MNIKGNSIRWNAQEVARLAIVTPKDLEEANRLWKRLMPKRYRFALEAKLKGDRDDH